jgi:hypothetical protein
MADLKTLAPAVLATLTTTSVATAANPTLYTVPAGKTLRITGIMFRDASASLVAATSVSVTGWRQTFSLATLTTANTGYLYVQALDLVQNTEVAAATAVVLTITTGTAQTCSIDLIGILT